MPSHFSRSLRIVETHNSRRGFLLFTLTVGLLGLWCAWLVAGRVTVFASTAKARLEVERENHPVDAVVGGRVETVLVKVGQVVRAGDALLEFDAVSERLAQDAEQARLAPTASQLLLLREELAAEEHALQEEERSAVAAAEQAASEVQRARAAADFAADEARRMRELQQRRLLSDLEALRAGNVAMERKTALQAAESASRKISPELEARAQDRRARIARLKREIATLEGTRAQAVAASDKAGYDVERRTVRAPIGGRIAEIASLTPGSVIAAGHRICAIVPDGELRVVADFTPAAALGRIRIGQPARVRLDGFPWTQFGTPLARVSSVSGEPHDGAIRVELSLEGAQASIPLQHGLPAEVDVEVERTSPASLILRSVGLYTRLTAAGR